LAVGAGSLLGLKARADGPPDAPRARMGVVIHSYSIRRSTDKESGFDDPLTFLNYCRALGAGGVQMPLGIRDDAYADKLRAWAETHKLYLEGSMTLPRDRADVARFAAEVRTAKQCGVTVFRTVLMNGRRYEVFDSAEEFRRFTDVGRQALTWA